MENDSRATYKFFKGRPDVFNGITVVTDEQAWKNLEEFRSLLTASLHHWEKVSIRGVWLKISIHNADLVGIIAKLGFVFHHAQPDYVMMTKWLPKDEPNMLPGYTSHYIGVGGFVLNEKNEMLVIQEGYGKAAWKLPGGTVDPGEELPNAVIREVYEETGISTEFVSIACFRHLHHFRFDRSDIYFVCHLRPLTTEIKMDPKEIAACRWMPVEEFLSHPGINETNKYYVKQCMAGVSPDRTVSIIPQVSRTMQVYSIQPTAEAFGSPSSSDVVQEESFNESQVNNNTPNST